MNDILTIAGLGCARAASLELLLHPLQVIKTEQQFSGVRSPVTVAFQIYQEKGWRGFYAGLSRQLTKCVIKPPIVWIMMTEMPKYLNRFTLRDESRLGITGICIASAVAATTNSLDNQKTGLILKIRSSDPWKALGPQFSRQSVSWVTFLITQNSLRKRYLLENQGKPLSLWQFSKIGVIVAAAVVATTAPFDLKTTLTQANIQSRAGRSLYLGWGPSFIILATHNLASALLISYLASR